MQPLSVERSQIWWHRLRANHLATRLAPGSFAAAAFAGLQDSAPRAALTALHARVDDVGPEDWEHPSLVQTRAPRGAVFVVPREDLAVFARGILPRDPDLERAVEALARRARDTLAEPRPEGAVEVGIEPVPAAVVEHLGRRPLGRLIPAIGGVQLRWDARTTLLVAGPAPELDAEEARRELARRFLRSLGPTTPARFSRWAAVTPADAAATFDALSDELVAVRWRGGSGMALAEDGERLAGAEPVAGIRFISFGGDPLLQPVEDYVSPPAVAKAALPSWACTGLVLVDGDFFATWGRRGGRITLLELVQIGPDQRREIELQALELPAITDVAWRQP